MQKSKYGENILDFQIYELRMPRTKMRSKLAESSPYCK